MTTAICSILHFFVDFTCAWAMFGRFAGKYEFFLLYNFCAFALQMPLGAWMDLLRGKHPKLPSLCAALGVALTAAGALTHPAVLGLGNALFHVGGGMAVMESDFARRSRGRELGIFVAPGALGLYAGTVLGKKYTDLLILAILALLMLLLTWKLFRQNPAPQQEKNQKTSVHTVFLCLACFLVVILRSWVGMAVTFAWKSTAAFAALSVFAAALGKLSGGLFASRFGMRSTVTATLLLSAACYLLGDSPLFGLAAIFFFNMTMPITLYLLVREIPDLRGFGFGLLTFGLFLGFLPVYARFALPVSGSVFGAAGSIASCILLVIAGKVAEHDPIPA